MPGSISVAQSTELSGTPGSGVTSVGMGTASAERKCCVPFITDIGSITSLSLNGVSSTNVVGGVISGGTVGGLAWFDNPTGTSGTFTITGTGGTAIFVNACIAVYGCSGAAFHSNFATTSSVSMNQDANGAMVCAAYDFPAVAMTWTNATDQVQYTSATTARFSAATTAPTSANTGLTITAATGVLTLGVSFSPAPATGKPYYYYQRPRRFRIPQRESPAIRRHPGLVDRFGQPLRKAA